MHRDRAIGLRESRKDKDGRIYYNVQAPPAFDYEVIKDISQSCSRGEL